MLLLFHPLCVLHGASCTSMAFSSFVSLAVLLLPNSTASLSQHFQLTHLLHGCRCCLNNSGEFHMHLELAGVVVTYALLSTTLYDKVSYYAIYHVYI